MCCAVRSSTWWASMCAPPLLCCQEALVHHLAQDCSAATSSALLLHTLDQRMLRWAATPRAVLHRLFQRLRAQHLLCSAAANALQAIRFRNCSVFNCSALLCRAVTTDDEDVAKQAIEVWNTIAEEEIDRQQVSLKFKSEQLSSSSSTGQVCKLPTRVQRATATLAVSVCTAPMAVQTSTCFMPARQCQSWLSPAHTRSCSMVVQLSTAWHVVLQSA